MTTTSNQPSTTRPAATTASRLVPMAIDAAFVVAFVALGRGAHSEGSAVGGTLKIAAPFLIALMVSWVVVLATVQRTPTAVRLAPTSVQFGLPVWIGTLALGMILRHTVFDKGTAWAFIVVAFLFLALFLVGWRAAWTTWRTRTAPRTS